MNPDDIRKLYDQERAATASEAAATQEQLRTDPELARRMYLALLAMASTDSAFRALANAVAQAAAIELIRRQMDADDTYALFVGQIMADALTPAPRTPRGRPKPARAA